MAMHAQLMFAALRHSSVYIIKKIVMMEIQVQLTDVILVQEYASILLKEQMVLPAMMEMPALLMMFLLLFPVLAVFARQGNS